MSAHPDKLEWGQQNVGIPALEVQEAIAKTKAMDEFAGVRYDAIEYYCDRLLFRTIPEQLDAALSVEDLKALAPTVTKVVFILLIRDFIRRYHDRLVAKVVRQNWAWVEKFTVKLLELTAAPVQPYVEWIVAIPDGEQEDSRRLISGLANQIGMAPATLWQLHTLMCEVVEEDLLAGPVQPKRNRPWWKFWS